MATTTTNFGWDIPQSTDLVKDGATAIAALGQDIDTALVDLKGGTTGQVLAKASGTDLDYSWTTPQVGDITAVTAGTGITGGGTSGAVTVSFDEANFGGGQGAAGKNILINGGFDIWQRGTSSATQGAYTTADRWWMNAASTTFSQETTTVPTGSRYALKAVTSGTTTVQFRQAIETMNAIAFAGKTVVLSGEYQASTTTTIQTKLFYSTSVDVAPAGSWTEITATSGGSVSAVNGSYTRSSSVFAVPSTTKSLMVLHDTGSVASGVSLYYGEIQLELGSIATPFQRVGGTIQGELAACQRYYTRSTAGGAYTWFGQGQSYNAANVVIGVQLPVAMRTTPTSIDYSNVALLSGATLTTSPSSFILETTESNNQIGRVTFIKSGFTAAVPYILLANNSTSAFLGFSAEL
jgi:hypothetical protein